MNERSERENQRISISLNLTVLNSVDHAIATSTSDSECVRVSVRLKSKCPSPNVAPINDSGFCAEMTE